MEYAEGGTPQTARETGVTATGPSLHEERALVADVLRKDRKATATFVARYADPLYAYVRQRLVPRTELADDIVQDVFVAALRGLDRFAGDASLQSWLLGIARHKVEDHYRARLRAMASLSDMDEDVLTVPVEMPALDEHIDRERLRDKTHRVLARLPEAYVTVLLWRYWEKRSARDMAEQAGRTEKSIERLLARARAQFRQAWDAD